MIVLCPLRAEQWPLYRDLRLRALRDAPEAFGSTLEAEAMRTDDDWAQRAMRAAAGTDDQSWFAVHGEDACGLVWGKRVAGDTVEVFQMWVDPQARGLGAGRRLLEAVIAWARGLGVTRVCLGVTVGESAAARLYRGQGFRPIGALEPLRKGSPLMCQAMELRLD
ncbi:Ribosomal protein S18 acetylase RimI [Pseudomonas japonica]|uniref:Ribosomal protein S18 acetylase RimI n=1 Tax=Pseudomonas japonica TaxID=256466 RepID=A0A239FZJ5_9PSED|nr:Ribosomal protein S18 acetylase RimI [Pseudomonas japonica]